MSKQPIVLRPEEEKQVEKGIRWSRVTAAHACILADLTRIVTKHELEKEPDAEDWKRLKKSLNDVLRLTEMFKKHPIHD